MAKRGTNWRNIVLALLIVYGIGAVIKVASKNENSKSQSTAKVRYDKQECVKVGILHSSEWWAKELDRPVSSVLSSFKINIWSKPSEHGECVKVGEMLPGSHAIIIEETNKDYKVESPFDGSIGWVDKMQFDGTAYMDSITNKPCTHKGYL